MKRLLCLVSLLCLLAAGLFAQADTLNLPMPQFSNPFYDAFTRNYLGTVNAGKGYTGVASLGDITSALLNPASVKPDSAQMFVEMNFKAQIDAEGYPLYARYTSPIPFGMLAVGGNLGKDFSAGIVYGIPKSLTLEDFSFYINQGGDIIQRFPTYNLHQITANAGYHKGNMHVGLNLHGQIHYNDDPIFLKTYDRVRDYQLSYRVQPGLIFDLGMAKLGLSVMPPSKFDWDLKYVTYEALAPLWLNGGMQFSYNGYDGALEAEWEQTSAIDDSFSDKLTFKAGVEKRHGVYVYRAGYHYSSNVFAGTIRLAQNTTANADTSMFWVDVPTSVNIVDNAQHSITVGFSYHHKIGSINLAAMQSIIGETPKTQINMSLGIYLSSFRPRKRILPDE